MPALHLLQQQQSAPPWQNPIFRGSTFPSHTSLQPQMGLAACSTSEQGYPAKVSELEEKKPTCCQQEKNWKQGFSPLPSTLHAYFFLIIC